MHIDLPKLKTENKIIDRAFRIALGDFTGNIVDYKNGLLSESAPVIIAGLDYTTPWTRDAAFNTWFAGGLLAPEAAKNSLLAVLPNEFPLKVGGEYWDAIIWVMGAWNYFLYTGDMEFLEKTLEVAKNSLAYFEENEFDLKDGLFRGGACFQDGIAAYPDKFVSKRFRSGILSCIKEEPDFLLASGGRLPMKALSTNCLYHLAYTISAKIRQQLKLPVDNELNVKANKLKTAVNKYFWNEEKGSYRYLLDADDELDRQEGLGQSFAIISGIASHEQTELILKNQYISPHGIPCVWPQYKRYEQIGNNVFARHSGTIWPQVNSTWAFAVTHAGQAEKGWFELELLAEKACRDMQFVEIYHPFTGMPYGGLQEEPKAKGIVEWESCSRQTWCATGYINMVLTVLCGMRFDESGIEFNPFMPDDMHKIELNGLKYRQMLIDISISRTKGEKYMEVNGVKCNCYRLSSESKGKINIEIKI